MGTKSIRVEYNFLSENLICKLKSARKETKLHGLNLTDWEYGVVKTSGPILLYKIEGPVLNELLTEIKVKVNIPVEADVHYAMHTLGGKYSWLPWHDDSNHKLSITIYLNEHWDRDWNGYFIYKDNLDYKAIIPEYNKAIVVEPPLWHCTVMPSVEAPIRESIQIFVK